MCKCWNLFATSLAALCFVQLASCERAAEPRAARAEEPGEVTSLPNASFPTLSLPREFTEAQQMQGPQWYAEAWSTADFALSLHGTPAVHVSLANSELARLPAPELFVRNRRARSTVNEGIRSLAWTESGVAWALEVECFDVEGDPRCTDDAFLVSVAEGLVSTRFGNTTSATAVTQ